MSVAITSTDLIKIIVGDGTTGTEATPAFETSADIKVLVRESGATTATEWVLNTDYTLSGAGTGADGVMTPITTKPSGSTIIIYTNPAPTISFDFTGIDPVLDTQLSSALRQIMLYARSLALQQRRVLKLELHDSVSVANTALVPIDTERAGDLLAWNASTSAPEDLDPDTIEGGGGASVGADLTAIEALTGTGYAKRTGVDTWAMQATVPEADVTGLTAALAAKAATSHSHVEGDVTGLTASLASSAAAAAWGGVTGTLSTQSDLQAALDAKRATTAATGELWRESDNSRIGGDFATVGKYAYDGANWGLVDSFFEITDTEDPSVGVPLDIDPFADGYTVYDSTATLTNDLAVTVATASQETGTILVIRRSGNNDSYIFTVNDVDSATAVTLEQGEAIVLSFDGTDWISLGIVSLTGGSGGGSVSTFNGSATTITASGNLTAARSANVITAGQPVAQVLVTKPATGSDSVTLTLPDDAAIGAWVIIRDPTHVGVLTVVNESSAGSLNGTNGATITISTKPNALAVVQVYEQPAAAATAIVTGDLESSTEAYGDFDGNGFVTYGWLGNVQTVSGTLTTLHSNAPLITSGDCTVPQSPGWTAIFRFGGAHTLTFNSLTTAAFASGDVASVTVWDSTTISCVEVESGSQVAFS